MCLGTKLSDRSLRRYKAKGKKFGYIRVWKTVEDIGKRFRPGYYPFNNHKLYTAGLNKATLNARSEQELIHAFRDRQSAIRWHCLDEVIVSAMVHPDWVMAVGETFNNEQITLTTKAIVMPKYPKRRLAVGEFREAIKGKKVKTYSWETLNALPSRTNAPRGA